MVRPKGSRNKPKIRVIRPAGLGMEAASLRIDDWGLLNQVDRACTVWLRKRGLIYEEILRGAYIGEASPGNEQEASLR
jgi:hypothetical protein